ncbi:hypothetical protein [Streptomyces sp. NPDC007905]
MGEYRRFFGTGVTVARTLRPLVVALLLLGAGVHRAGCCWAR